MKNQKAFNAVCNLKAFPAALLHNHSKNSFKKLQNHTNFNLNSNFQTNFKIKKIIENMKYDVWNMKYEVHKTSEEDDVSESIFKYLKKN